MSRNSWLQNLRSTLAPRRGQRHRRRGSPPAAMHRPRLELLEDRALLTFLAPVDYAVGSTPLAIVSADFNNDTVLDLAIANANSNTVSVLLGNMDAEGKADGTFQPAVPYDTGSYPLSLAVGDLDGDGKIDDLATANYYGYDVSVLLGNDDGTFQPASSVGIGSRPASVAVGDFDGDGLFDLGVTSNFYDYWSYSYYGVANVLLGTGGGNFSSPNSTFLDYGYYNSALAADLNGDSYDDFVTFESYGSVVVLVGDSSGYLQGPTGWFYTGDYSAGVAAGDLDGDLDNDLVLPNFWGSSVGVLVGDGSGGFSGPSNYATGANPYAIVLGDFTHDDNLDAATTNYYSGQLSIVYGDGTGAFSGPVFADAGSYPAPVAAGDFNGDGWLDAATANSDSGTVSVLINDQNWPAPPPPPPSIIILDAGTVIEGDGVSAQFTVQVLGNPDGVSVQYSTGYGSAIAGEDYEFTSETLVFGSGVDSQTISVPILDDSLDEFSEDFYVSISQAVGGIITDSQGFATIQDNDEAPLITINDVSKLEGNSGRTSFTFVVSLSEPSAKQVSVNFATASGTATASSGDYVAAGGTIYFAPGQTEQTITVFVNGDKKKETNETFFVNLSGASNATINDGQGVGTIGNDDGGGGKGGGKGKPNSGSLAAALLADDVLTTTRKKK